MNTFLAILTIMAAPTSVASNEALTLTPETTITFEAPSAKKVESSCERVRKALVAGDRIAFCGEVVAQ